MLFDAKKVYRELKEATSIGNFAIVIRNEIIDTVCLEQDASSLDYVMWNALVKRLEDDDCNGMLEAMVKVANDANLNHRSDYCNQANDSELMEQFLALWENLKYELHHAI